MSETGSFELGTDGPSLILVGVDGSRTSLRAASYAGGLARRQHCPLAAVYATKVPVAAGFDPGAGMAAAIASDNVAQELQRIIDERQGDLGVEVRLHIDAGDPFTVIKKFAEALRADAVIVGASESAGHRFVGSLATRLVRAGRWPVTVVP